MKSVFTGSARVAAAFLVGFLIISAKPSVAETPFQPSQEPVQPQKSQDPKILSTSTVAETASPAATVAEPVKESVEAEELAVSEPVHYVATAYSLRGRTASGRLVSKGIIAADPRLLPLGSRVRLEAGGYSGEYLVADTGGAVRGRRIDIWTPSTREAFRFGRRTVKLTVLSYGAKRVPRAARKSKTKRINN